MSICAAVNSLMYDGMEILVAELMQYPQYVSMIANRKDRVMDISSKAETYLPQPAKELEVVSSVTGSSAQRLANG